MSEDQMLITMTGDVTFAAGSVVVNMTQESPAVLARLDALGAQMATEAEQITALSGKFDDLMNDVRTALAALVAERNNLGTEGQAALDTLSARVDAFDAEVTAPPA